MIYYLIFEHLFPAILCSKLSVPENGEVTFNSQPFNVGTTATYSCYPGYILVGETTRTCEDTNRGTTGTWNGTMPLCEGSIKHLTKIMLKQLTSYYVEIITCQPLTQPSNGAVTISSGAHKVTLGRGATATYSCNTGYGLIGQENRTCVVTDGGTNATWSGNEPTCWGECNTCI